MYGAAQIKPYVLLVSVLVGGSFIALLGDNVVGQQTEMSAEDKAKYAAAVAKYARTPKNAAEFATMFKQVSNWGRWGKNDEIGTLNLVTESKRKAAAALVKSGVSVSLSRWIDTEKGPDNPTPPQWTIAKTLSADTLTISPHGLLHSHIDALCHYNFNGQYYNGLKQSEVVNAEQGCIKMGIDHLKNGIVTRGILIDMPRLKNVPYLEPGTPVYAEDIEAWEKKAGVKIGSGDAVFLHTGRWIRRAKTGPWGLLPAPPNPGAAGFHVSVVAAIFKPRDVTFVGSDGPEDVLPSYVQDMATPLHTMAIAGLGVWLFDHQDLTALAETCAKLNRWEFMLTGAPLALKGSTGTAANLTATF